MTFSDKIEPPYVCLLASKEKSRGLNRVDLFLGLLTLPENRSVQVLRSTNVQFQFSHINRTIREPGA